MVTNYIQLTVKIRNPAEVVVIERKCFFITKSMRRTKGREFAASIFKVGLFRRLGNSSVVIGIPPHRIQEITIGSFIREEK